MVVAINSGLGGNFTRWQCNEIARGFSTLFSPFLQTFGRWKVAEKLRIFSE